MDFKPIKTDKKSKAGRPVWKNPKTGEQYSELTRTIPVDVDPKTGKPKANTRWVNVPTVFEGGNIMDDEDFLAKFYRENGYKDPLTGKRLQIFKSEPEASSAAKDRSDSLLDD